MMGVPPLGSGGWRRSPARVRGSSRAGAAVPLAGSAGVADGHQDVGGADRAAGLGGGDDGGLVVGGEGDAGGGGAGGGGGVMGAGWLSGMRAMRAAGLPAAVTAASPSSR